MERPRVVITGIGILCPMADTVQQFGDALFAGQTCIGPLEGWEVPDARFRLGGQIKGYDLSRELPMVDTKRMLRYSQFALSAANRAIHDADLPLEQLNRERVGTSFGTAAAGLGETIHTEAKRYFHRGDHGVSPLAWAEFTPCACTTHIAIHFGLQGPNATHSSGCVTGGDAIAWAVGEIQAGHADVMVAGGADAPFFPFIWAGLYRSGLIAPDPNDGGSIPRPFSHDHAGIALVEGGSAIILESESHARLRGARIYGEILGTASCEEARPITNLDTTGHAFSVTIHKTLRNAGLPASEIDWVCAHGTGYPVADCSESRGIENALGPHAYCVPVSSIRGAVGQSFASGGGFQLAAACLAIQRQMVPPTLNFSSPAEDCRLDYVPNVARTARVRNAMVCAAGVGGTHAGMIIGTYRR